MSIEELECVEINPVGDHRYSVIWLHGLGADGHDFEGIVPELRLPESAGIRFVFPHAPHREVTINGGMSMRAWYDIKEMSLDRNIDRDGIDESVAQLEQLIAKEREKGIGDSNIVIAGFSQGGAIAMTHACLHPQQFAGILALSTYIPDATVIDSERSPKSPIFQCHGLQDPVVPLALGEMTRDQLLEIGAEIQFNTYPMPHAVHPDEIQDIAEWFKRVLAL